MGGLLKMVQNLEFMQQDPLAELQIPMQMIFPTVLAISKISEKVEDEARKYRQTWGNANARTARSEKKQSDLQKPDRQEVSKMEKETSTYSLVYFNPETKNAEIVEGSVSLAYEDETEQVIEEALGQRSALGMYSLIATPLIREQVDERMMQEIMDRIKIESPSPFGGGAPVRVTYESLSPKIMEEYGEKIIALEIAEKRKMSMEERLAAQIHIVGEVLKNFDLPKKDTREAIMALPPLSRARTIAIFRKKRISRKVVRDLLLKDLQFLKAVKQKVGAMRVQDILRVVLKIKK